MSTTRNTKYLLIRFVGQGYQGWSEMGVVTIDDYWSKYKYKKSQQKLKKRGDDYVVLPIDRVGGWDKLIKVANG